MDEQTVEKRYFPPNNTDNEEQAFTRNGGVLELRKHRDGVIVTGDRMGYLLTPRLALKVAADLTRLAQRVLEERRKRE